MTIKILGYQITITFKFKVNISKLTRFTYTYKDYVDTIKNYQL
jgi:hypothetical protein